MFHLSLPLYFTSSQAAHALRLAQGHLMFSSLHQALETVSLALDLMPTGGTPIAPTPTNSTSSPGSGAFSGGSSVDHSRHLVTRARVSFERCYRCAHIHSSGDNTGNNGGGSGGGSGGSSPGGGSFEWVDGVVVKALKTGAWLLIDNVNLCSPSVLDRLNSLLEPNGSLLVTER